MRNALKLTTPTDREIVVVREFDAPRELVWDSIFKPELLRQACESAGVPLRLRMQEGYDHSYFFIATFIDDHLRFHAGNLSR